MDCSLPGSSVHGILQARILVSTKKDAQLESFELSFIWGKMRTAAQEAAPQIALRGCSKEAGGGGLIYKILVKGGVQCKEFLF